MERHGKKGLLFRYSYLLCEWTEPSKNHILGTPGSPNPGKAEGAAAAVLHDGANQAFFA